MQIPVLSGIYTDTDARFRVSYPVNLVPVPTSNGIGNLYLRPVEGLAELATTPGLDRGGINWNGVCYRVIGTNLVSVAADGVQTTLGAIPGTDRVVMTYSFDRLAIKANEDLYYYDSGTGVTQVTDPDLGTVLDVLWVDGYFMTTDGEFIVVTDLSDPYAVNPLKYGSSEVDPDPVVSIIKIRNEPHAINRYTIEVFDNLGGDLFPFQRIEGAQITKGAVGTHACCEFENAIAFLGSGRNEPLGIHLGYNGQSVKISTNDIDKILKDFTEAALTETVVESRIDNAHRYLYVHLPDRTLIYDAGATQAIGSPVWFIVTSASVDYAQYQARNFVWAYDKWIFGDPTANRLGTFDNGASSHYGTDVRWEFGTAIFYNNGQGAVFHELELIALDESSAETTINTSHSFDGQTYSPDAPVTAGNGKRISWRRQGKMRQWRTQRFTGDTSAKMSFAALEARLEPLMF